MRIVVSDSSCLIDLRKVLLLDALLRLPFEFLIPDTLFEDELVKFTATQKKALLRGGLKVIELPGERVLRAQAVIREAHVWLRKTSDAGRWLLGQPDRHMW
jgi:hypothetical protein